MSRRIALRIEYDGTNYAGWQNQKNALSVQQCVEEALSSLFSRHIPVTGASRTDSGVHALGQVAHLVVDSSIPAHKLSFALNTRLPPDIRVSASWEAADDFHARFHAAGKVYGYTILNAPHAGALLRRFSCHCPVHLDEGLMHAAAQDMVGLHNFSAFMASGGTSKTFERRMHAAQVKRKGDTLCFMIYGTGFLYNMVRIAAGTLMEIGQGKLPSDSLRRAIETGNRLDLGATAPAQGLTLMRVLYAGEEGAAQEMLNRGFVL